MVKQQPSSTQTSVAAILMLNCGSSSIKFSLIQPKLGTSLLLAQLLKLKYAGKL
ncbi:MAG: hypothetical protein JKX76_13685 [Colwellia sp.]|nr:hypothetical protein [Colwellia sp.]